MVGNVIVIEGLVVDEANVAHPQLLLIDSKTFVVLDAGFNGVDGIVGSDIKREDTASKCTYKNLHLEVGVGVGVVGCRGGVARWLAIVVVSWRSVRIGGAAGGVLGGVGIVGIVLFASDFAFLCSSIGMSVGRLVGCGSVGGGGNGA